MTMTRKSMRLSKRHQYWRVDAMGQVGTWYPNYSQPGSHIVKYKKGPSLL